MPTLHDWNSFIRPNLWIATLTVYALGLLATKQWYAVDPLSFLVGSVIVILLTTGSITVNHYYDYETDRKNKKELWRFPVALGRIPRAFAARFSQLVLTFAYVLSILFLNTHAQLVVLLSFLLILMYSAPPFRVKGQPAIEIVVNGLGYGVMPFYLALAVAGYTVVDMPVALLGLVPFFVTASGHMLLELPDLHADRRARVRTSAVAYGHEAIVRTSKLFVGLAGLTIVYLLYLGYLNQLALFSLLTGAFVYATHRKMRGDVRATFRPLQIAYLIGGALFLLSLL